MAESNKSVHKMEIALDEKCIVQAGNYSVAEIQERLLGIMDTVGLKQKEPGVFYGQGNSDDYSRCGGAIIMLKRQGWFMPFIKRWLWYTDTGVEDVAEQLRKQR